MPTIDRRIPTRKDRILLAESFPACFVKPGTRAPKRPLKIGIEKDIAERGVTGPGGHRIGMWRVKRALQDYCSGRRYQEAILRDPVRVDLDGNPAGPVAPECRPLAQHRLEQIDCMSRRKAA